MHICPEALIHVYVSEKKSYKISTSPQLATMTSTLRRQFGRMCTKQQSVGYLIADEVEQSRT